jgi:hypothetical protein
VRPGRRAWARHRRLCGLLVRPPTALDQDAPGLCPVGLVKRWGAEATEAACARAADAEAFNVGLIARMIERATTEVDGPSDPPRPPAAPGRFSREPEHFATTRPLPKGASPDEVASDMAEEGVA